MGENNSHWTSALGIGFVVCLASSAIAEIRQPVNYFVMQQVHGQNVSDSILSSPKLQGIHIRDEWQLVEPLPGTFSFDWIDGQIDRAIRLEKQITLGIYTGNNSPAWLAVPLIDSVPIPWDAGVILAHNQMVAALGARYNNDATVVAVHMSAPATDASLEMHFPDGLTKAAGYSDSMVIDSWKSAIDAYSAAFPNTALVLDVAIVPKSGEVPLDRRGVVTDAVVDYARQTLGERANFIHCSLKASTSIDAPHHQKLVELGQAGARVGFEMVGPSIDADRFGGPFVDALTLGEQANATWYQVYQSDVALIPDVSIRLDGDYNGDLVVNAADYTIWRNTVGGTNLAADGNRDGVVDQFDYAVWKTNFQAGSGSAASPLSADSPSPIVPEPTTILLSFFAVIVGSLLRSRSNLRAAGHCDAWTGPLRAHYCGLQPSDWRT